VSDQPPYPPSDLPFGGYGTQPGPERYSATAAISYGWRKFTENAGTFMVLGLLYFLVPSVVGGVGTGYSLAGDFAAEQVNTDGAEGAISLVSGSIDLLSVIASQVLTIVFSAAILRAAFDVTEGRRPEIGAAFTRWNFWKLLLLALLVALASCVIAIVGIMLIIPLVVVDQPASIAAAVVIGVLLAVALCMLGFLTWFGPSFIVARGAGATEAYWASIRFTKANLGSVFVLMLLSVLVMIAGFLACCVGLIVAMPIASIAAAYSFKVLQGEPVAP
jgi:uncharacterized membrane protein